MTQPNSKPKPVEAQESQESNTVSREKVKARLLALEWNTNLPSGEPVKIQQGQVVTIYRDQFDSMNDSFRPSWEEVKEGE